MKEQDILLMNGTTKMYRDRDGYAVEVLNGSNGSAISIQRFNPRNQQNLDLARKYYNLKTGG